VSFAVRPRPAHPAAALPAAAPARSELDVSVPGPYVGLVTRAIAFALDAAIINLVAILTSAVVALTFSVVSIPEELRTLAVAAGGTLYFVWVVGYFVAFWSTTGQTPGSRVFHIRVRPASGDRLRPRRALVRFAGLTLAALPLFAGFLIILVDDRRRGLHDRIARTVVVEAEDARPAKRPRRTVGSGVGGEDSMTKDGSDEPG
jgi:uncharacterized RDD family membrane protein YckC